MSVPRCIRLAIRSCRPAKISSPAARCQKRFLATTQHCRDADKIDIKAGFPTIPASAEDGSPKPIHQDIPKTPVKRKAKRAATAAPQSRVTIELQRDRSRGEKETTSDSEDRRLIVTHPGQKIYKPQLRELFSDYDVELILPGKYAVVVLKTAEDAQRAITELTGKELPARKESNTVAKPAQERAKTQATEQPTPEISEDKPRPPLNVVAAYHKPLRIEPHLGIRVASLQLRSYSVRNLEFMCDFALRAAYFLGLPASGPVPLPKKIERWTMPRSNFVHKKSQENFERITRRRAIQIMDGHKDVVQIWLAYLRKHQFYGVGMKADVWEFEGMDVAGTMDAQFQEVEKELDEKLSMFGWNKHVAGDQSLTEQLRNMGPGQQTGASMMYVREGSRSQSRI